MEEEEYNQRPAWKTVLTIILGIIALVRVGILCSKMDDPPRQSTLQVDFLMPDRQSFSEETAQGSSLPRKTFNNMLYKKYKDLVDLSESQRKAFYLLKLEKDSLVSLDLQTQLKVEKGSFLQNTHDDSLMFAFKTPKNLNVFVHDFESNSSVDASFKQLKAGSKLKNYRDFIKLSRNTKLVSYSIAKSGEKFKGIAYAFSKDRYKMFIEFESNTLRQIDLEHQALNYIAKHIKVVKQE